MESEHGGDAGPDDELLLGGAEGARPDGDGEVVEGADPAHAEPGDERLSPGWSSRERPSASRQASGRTSTMSRTASSQPSQPGVPRPSRVSIEPSARITVSSSSFSIRSAPSCTV